ncbi:MAG: DUF5686 family protein, partial [Flavobacteriales bacterium]
TFKEIKPQGDLKPFEFFKTEDRNEIVGINKIKINQMRFYLRYAPNEQYYQGRSYKIPIINEFPIIELTHKMGFEGLLNADYSFQNSKLELFKRIYMTPFGYSDFEFKAGKIWNKVPYPLLALPSANQSFAYRLSSFNLMNFLEFQNDQYVSLYINHFFNGYILNKIPLFKRLKLRGVAGFKLLWGNLSDKNDPRKSHDQFKFPRTRDGDQATFEMDEGPYMEGSVGVKNIFKFLRVSVLKRFNYLDHPNISSFLGTKGWGVRIRAEFEF